MLTFYSFIFQSSQEITTRCWQLTSYLRPVIIHSCYCYIRTAASQLSLTANILIRSNALINITFIPKMLSTRTNKNPALKAKIEQMALPLAPLVRLTTGQVHPAFPLTLLNFWLLNSEQLDDLAHFYHQRTPSDWSAHYPCPVIWGKNLTLEEKRRKLGRFIGLRGCESPIKTEEMIIEEVRRRVHEAEEEEMLGRKAKWY